MKVYQIGGGAFQAFTLTTQRTSSILPDHPCDIDGDAISRKTAADILKEARQGAGVLLIHKEA